MHIDGQNIQNSNHLILSQDAEECQKHCQYSFECNYFVYEMKTKECLLKRSDGNKSFKETSVVGPKFCGSNNIDIKWRVIFILRINRVPEISVLLTLPPFHFSLF